MARAALLCLAMLAACAPLPELHRPIPRVDDQTEIFWIDSYNVLYRGFTDSVLALGNPPADLALSPKAIRILDILTGEDRELIRADFGGICYSRGTILYQRRDPDSGRGIYVYGPLDGKHRPYPDQEGGIDSYLRCSSPQKPTTPSEAHRVVALLEEHGFVEFRTVDRFDGRKDEIWLHDSRGEPKLVQAYRGGDALSLRNYAPIYAPWKKAYFVYREGPAGVAWWLYPDGRAEPIDLPGQVRGQLRPVRCGILVSQVEKVSQFHLLREQQMVDLDLSRVAPEGTPVWRAAVSPDGARAALRRTLGTSSSGPAFLEIVDICP